MSQTLSGQHALVTGGSRGIGAVIARQLEAAGAKVSCIARHSTDENIFRADVSDANAVAAAFTAARAKHGPITLLINNAGNASSAPFLKTTTQDLQALLNVHLIGAWHCIQQALPDMIAAQQGRIINIASTAAQTGYAYVSAYCAAKHALLGLTRSLAQEMALSANTRNITVNAICPGYTDTDIVRDAIANIARVSGRSNEQALASLLKTNPQGRLIRPDEIATAAVWLCQPEAAAMTGQSLSLSSGELMP